MALRKRFLRLEEYLAPVKFLNSQLNSFQKDS